MALRLQSRGDQRTHQTSRGDFYKTCRRARSWTYYRAQISIAPRTDLLFPSCFALLDSPLFPCFPCPLLRSPTTSRAAGTRLRGRHTLPTAIRVVLYPSIRPKHTAVATRSRSLVLEVTAATPSSELLRFQAVMSTFAHGCKRSLRQLLRHVIHLLTLPKAIFQGPDI